LESIEWAEREWLDWFNSLLRIQTRRAWVNKPLS
jgi:hypothetical protein